MTGRLLPRLAVAGAFMLLGACAAFVDALIRGLAAIEHATPRTDAACAVPESLEPGDPATLIGSSTPGVSQ